MKKLLYFGIIPALFLAFVLSGCGGGNSGGGNPPNLPWTKQLGSSSNDFGYGVAVDGGGNVYVTGCTNGGLDGNSSTGMDDLFLVKYDSTGTKQWTRQLGSSNVDRAFGVAVDSGGNIYVAGCTYGGLDGNTNAGNTDLFLVKYDSAGVKQWTRQLGSSSEDLGYGVAVDGSNVYVTGHTIGGIDGNTNAGLDDLFLVKYDSDGIKQWTRQLGSSSNDYGRGVAVDSGGNIYVTGYTEGRLDGNTSTGGMDLFIVEYDSTGASKWTRQLGSSSDDYGIGVALDSSGIVYVTGYTYGGLDGNTNAGGIDLFIVKYDSTGASKWTRQLGSSSNTCGTGVAVDDGGNLYVTGYTFGGLDGNTNAGGCDLFLVKYDLAGVKQ